MKRLITILALFVAFGAVGSTWAAGAPSLMAVSASKRHATHHHAHKAAKHHQPKHRRTV